MKIDYEHEEGAMVMKQMLRCVARCCLMLLILGAAGATAQTRGLVDIAQLGGNCIAIRIVGNLAYVAEETGLTILNITNRERPVRVGGLALSFRVRDLAVAGTKAYVAGYDTMQVVDVANAATPLPQGRIQIPRNDSPINSIAVKGAFLYLACYSNKIMIYDVSYPPAPVSRGVFLMNNEPCQLAVSGNRLYVVSRISTNPYGFNSVLHALDLGNPEKPVLKGSLTLEMSVWTHRLAINGTTVVVGHINSYMNSSVHVIDAGNPAAMVDRQKITLPRMLHGLGIEGTRIYVNEVDTSDISHYDNRMQVYEAGPAGVKILGNCAIPAGHGDHAEVQGAIGVVGGYAYHAYCMDDISIVNARTPAAPRLAGVYGRPKEPVDAALNGNRLYVADRFYGMKVMDVSRPGAPACLGSYLAPEIPLSVAAAGTRVYLGTQQRLHILDASNPAAPRLLGAYPYPSDPLAYPPWEVHGVAVRGNLAYLAAGVNGLRILDVSNPARPVVIGSFPLYGADVALWGNYALVRGDELAIVDISNPRAPKQVGSIPERMDDFVVAGNLVYWTAFDRTNIHDISNPRLPKLRASLKMMDAVSWTSRLGLNGAQLYVATYGGIIVINVSNPDRPIVAGVYPADILPTSLNVVGGDVYTGLWEGEGYRVFRNTPINVFSPGGPATFKGGDAVRLHWKSDLPNAGTGMMLELWNSVGRVASLGYDWSPRGENGRLINLPLVPVGSDYRLRVRSTWNSQLWGQSERPFTITGGPVRVQSPNGGETWQAGTRQNVWWKVNPQLAGGTVWIELWRAGKKVARLGAGVDADGEAVTSVWAPPTLAAGTDYKIRVISAYKPGWWDESDGAITIRK